MTSLSLSPEDIKAIQKLPRDLWFTATIELSNARQAGREIGNLRAYAAKVDHYELSEKSPRPTRAERRAGKKLPPVVKVPLDAEGRDGTYSFAEQIAATDPADLIDDILSARSRWDVLDEKGEAVLDLMQQGTRCIAASLGLTQRRIQQIFKAHIERARRESDFTAGAAGSQGGLFAFDGELANSRAQLREGV